MMTAARQLFEYRRGDYRGFPRRLWVTLAGLKVCDIEADEEPEFWEFAADKEQGESGVRVSDPRHGHENADVIKNAYTPHS